MINNYKSELCNWNNPEDAKFLSSLLYNCTFINGERGKSLKINYLYFKHHGTEEEFQNAKQELKDFRKKQNKIANELEKKLKKSPNNVKTIKQSFIFLDIEYSLQIERKVS